MKVTLETKPVSPSAGSIEQDQNDRELLLPPQVVIADVQVANVGGPHSLQVLRCFELQVNQARFGVTLLVEGEQQQIVAVVLFYSLRRVAPVNNEPLDVIDTLVGNHVLPGALL